MQSSAMMALRALVLVVCLVAVPLFAIFGKDAPQVVRSLIQNIAGASPRTLERGTANINEPPVFRPAALTASPSPVGLGGSPPNDAIRAGSLAPLTDQDAAHSNRAAPPFVPSSDNRLAAPSAPAAIESEPPAVTPQSPGHHSSPVQPAADPFAPRPQLPGPASFPPDYFRAAEDRLRQLGATYYLLETTGPAGDNYRFYCKVASSNKPDEVFAFFATDHDPLKAIDSVVRQVEGWRSHWMQ